MEQNFKRLIISNGVLFVFAVVAMFVERATVPNDLAAVINRLYGSPSSFLGDVLILVLSYCLFLRFVFSL